MCSPMSPRARVMGDVGYWKASFLAWEEQTMAGSTVRLWKQDPSVTAIGVRKSYIHTPVDHGPRDDEITITGMPDVQHDQNGDFLVDRAEDPKGFDAVHTFAVVRQVVTMFKRALRRANIGATFEWQWGAGDPIRVYPHAGIEANAYYSRGARCLRFFYFHPDGDPSNPLVYTCRSFDIVAHETGHAILDALRPGYWASWHPQTGGLHESFGDLTAIFTMLAQMDQCETIIAESKADLHAKGLYFSEVAEQFGHELLNHDYGLRNADNDKKLSEVSTEVHDISQVFTGAVYDILADAFVDHLKLDEYDPAETLFRVGKHMTTLTLAAIVLGPERDATYTDIARKMIEIEPIERWKTFIEQRFAEREVLRAPVGLVATQPKTLSWHECCGTMTQPEHLNPVEAAITEAHTAAPTRRTTERA